MPSKWEDDSERIFLKPKLGLVSAVGLIVGTMIGKLYCLQIFPRYAVFYHYLVNYIKYICEDFV